MQTVKFSLPAMWADHHVLAVRQALAQIGGVQEVVASSLYKDVLIQYDPGTVAPDALANTLLQAGFAIGAEPSLPTHPVRIDDASDWFRLQDRITVTDRRDLEMSGDFRKY